MSGDLSVEEQKQKANNRRAKSVIMHFTFSKLPKCQLLRKKMSLFPSMNDNGVCDSYLHLRLTRAAKTVAGDSGFAQGDCHGKPRIGL